MHEERRQARPQNRDTAETRERGIGDGLLDRRSPDELERFLEYRRGFRLVEARPKDVVDEGPMRGMVHLELLERDRSSRPGIAHADCAAFEFVLSIR